MKVKLAQQITGTRDGQRWAAPGSVVDLPDQEAAKLLASGVASPVERVVPEKATAAKPETRRRG